jgi:DNA-binding MarR family transcriptional regulator
MDKTPISTKPTDGPDQDLILDPQLDLNVAMCTCASLRKTTRVVTQLFDAALKPVGLTPGQFTVLATLSRIGEQPQTKLAKKLLMDRTTMIRNLRPLEDKGFVETDRSGIRGAKVLRLTDDGRQALETALPHWQQAQSQIVNALGAARWGGLITDLGATVEAVQQL